MSDPSRRILVVADEPARLDRVTAILRSTAHRLTLVNPAEAARRVEHGDTFDLLVVSIEPPDMAGFEAVRVFHRALGAELPVLAVSEAFKREHIEGMLENSGVRRLFPPAVPAEELLFWVNYALFPETMRSRRAPRLPVSFVLAIARRKRLLRGRAYNLSEDGLFLETVRVGAAGEIVELRFRLPAGRSKGDTIAARCEIVWSNPKPRSGGAGQGPYGVGLRFVDLDDAARRAIKSYVFNGILEQSI